MIDTIARIAAERLGGQLGSSLSSEVETALYGEDVRQRPEQYAADAVSLGSLIVTVATLAWTIYSELRKEASTPSPTVVASRIRIQLGGIRAVDDAEMDRIIEVVVSETMRIASTEEDTSGL